MPIMIPLRHQPLTELALLLVLHVHVVCSHVQQHPPDVLTQAFLKTPCSSAPACRVGQTINMKASVSGLVSGPTYTVVFNVQRGTDRVHSSSEIVRRPSVPKSNTELSGATPPSYQSAYFTSQLHIAITPEQHGLHSVGVHVYDSFPGLDENESFLTQSIINVVITPHEKAPDLTAASKGGAHGESTSHTHRASALSAIDDSTIDSKSPQAFFEESEQEGAARNLCLIAGNCFMYPEFNGRHDDSPLAYTWGVGIDRDVCLARARQWHMYCNNSLGSPTTATFVPTLDNYTFPHTGVDTESVMPKEWVMLLHVTDGYMDFFDNFWQHYLLIESWSVEHVVKVIVSSSSSAEYIRTRYGSSIDVTIGPYFGNKPYGYNDRKFTTLVRQRPSVIRSHLLNDTNVLYIDVDVVLRADPFTSLTAGYDIWTTMDHSFVHCTGIMALRASARVIEFLADWDALMSTDPPGMTRVHNSPLPPLDLGNGNQAAFNQLLSTHHNFDLTVFKLPQALFPPGSLYFGAQADSLLFNRSKVVAIHNNFIVGHAAKKHRFINHSLWLTAAHAPPLPALPPSLPIAGKRPSSRLSVRDIDPDEEKAHIENKSGGHQPWANRETVREASMYEIMPPTPQPNAAGSADAAMRTARHPVEELVTLTLLLRGSLRFVAEEAVDLQLSLMGAVVGANYSFRLVISESEVLGTHVQTLYKSVTPFTVTQHSIDRIVTHLAIPPFYRQGRVTLQISFVDEYPGLLEDEALLTYTRRVIEFWSEGCIATPLWPLRAQGQNGSSFECGSHHQALRGAKAGVTLATVASIDRLAQLTTLASLWDGPMSVALYARTKEEEQALVDLISGEFSGWLTKRKQLLRIVLVSACWKDADHQDFYSFPINVLRSHAVGCADTELVMFVDVDFLPSARASAFIEHHSGAVDFLSEVLVVPCFKQAFPRQAHWPRAAAFSKDLNDEYEVAMEAIEVQEVLPFIANGSLVVPGPNHGSSDYFTWLQAAAKGGHTNTHSKHTSSYAVSYTLGWEPYIVINKKLWKGLSHHGMFDRRFRLNGWDKASFIYEVATRGYKFRTLHGVFLVHATEHALRACPVQMFGASFCDISAATAGSGWYHSQESRNLFASFVHSLSHSRSVHDADDGASDVKMETAMENGCLIFPFILLHKLPVSFIDGWLDSAYQAHAQALHELEASFVSSQSNSLRNVSSISEAAQTRYSTPLDWLVTQRWAIFANAWCVSVPALLGIVSQLEGGKGPVSYFHVDARVWEQYSAPAGPPLRFRHCINDINRLTKLDRVQRSDTEVVLFAQAQLAHLCTETDPGSKLWQCSVETFIEDSDRNIVLHVRREALLLERPDASFATSAATSTIAATSASDTATQTTTPSEHESNLMSRLLVAEAQLAQEILLKTAAQNALQQAQNALAQESREKQVFQNALVVALQDLAGVQQAPNDSRKVQPNLLTPV